MKKVLAVLMIVMMTIGLCACGGGGSADDEMLKIGVLQLVKHDALDKTYQGFVDGLKELGY